jgi:hypothetical protein
LSAKKPSTEEPTNKEEESDSDADSDASDGDNDAETAKSPAKVLTTSAKTSAALPPGDIVRQDSLEKKNKEPLVVFFK